MTTSAPAVAQSVPDNSVRTALRSPKLLRTEVLAGLVVALALIPEAISFSIIAGVDPQVGLFASFTMAVVISFLGGRPAMISAATGAIALVIAPVMREHGLDYLIATVLLGGLIQVALGLGGFGKLMRFIPRSVMVGFVNALAILIFMAQVPYLVDVPWLVYPMIAIGIAVMVGLPRVTKVIPAPLVAIVALTGFTVLAAITVPDVGDEGELPHRARPVRALLGRCRRCRLGRPGDRRTRRDGDGGGHHAAGRVRGPRRPLRSRRARQGGLATGDGTRDRYPARADHRRLPARALLVGVDLPDQRPDRDHRRDRHRGLLPESRDPSPRRPDVLGAGLSTAGLTSLVYGVIEVPGRGWSDPVTIGAISAGVVVLTGFVAWEVRVRDPMIDLHLFARPQFLWASIAGVLVTFGMLGLLFVVPQYLQFVAGHNALGTGLRLLPLIGGLVVGAPAGERLAARAGYRVPVSAGLAVLAAGVAIGALTGLQSSYGFVAA